MLVTATAPLLAGEVEPGFTPLCDGKTFDGWKPAEVNKDTWKIEDGAFVTRGKTCHLFYVGDLQPFKNFDLKVDVMTDHGSNGGIYFHTKYQTEGWPQGRVRVPGQQHPHRLDPDRQPLRPGQHRRFAGPGQRVVDAGDYRPGQQRDGAD